MMNLRDSDVYENLLTPWIWPNRARDLDYASLGRAELEELRVGCVEAGWKMPSASAILEFGRGGFNNHDVNEKKAAKAMLSAQRAWFDASPGSHARLLAAHAWHSWRAYLPVWEPSMMLILGPGEFLRGGLDACGDLLYTSFSCVEELQRVVLNAIVRGLMWLRRRDRLFKMGVASGDGVSARDVEFCARRLDDCLKLWEYRRRDGWSTFVGDWVRNPDPSVDLGVSSWRELNCLMMLGSGLSGALDRFSRVAVNRAERRVVTRTQSICATTFAKNVTLMLPVIISAGGAEG